MEGTKMDLGDFLKNELRERGWSINHFYLLTLQASQGGKYGSVGRTNISDIIKKRIAMPSPRIIRVLARTLGVSYYTLLEIAGYINIEEFKAEFCRKK